MLCADWASPASPASASMQSRPGRSEGGPRKPRRRNLRLKTRQRDTRSNTSAPYRIRMGSGPPPARGQKALQGSQARRDRSATGRNTGELIGQLARNEPILLGSPIAGTARKAARRRGRAPCRRVRAPGSRSAAGSSGRADARAHRAPLATLRMHPNLRARPCRRARLCGCRRVRRPAPPPRAMNAPRGTRPLLPIEANTVSTPAPFTRIVPRPGARRVWTSWACSHIGL